MAHDEQDAIVLRKPEGTSRGFGFITYDDEVAVEKVGLRPPVSGKKGRKVRRKKHNNQGPLLSKAFSCLSRGSGHPLALPSPPQCLVMPHSLNGRTVEVKRAIGREQTRQAGQAEGQGYQQAGAGQAGGALAASSGGGAAAGDRSSKQADWVCPDCENRNYGFRQVCNRCKAAKPGSAAATGRAMAASGAAGLAGSTPAGYQAAGGVPAGGLQSSMAAGNMFGALPAGVIPAAMLQSLAYGGYGTAGGGYGAAGSGYGAAGSGYGAAGSGYGVAGSGYGVAGSGYGAAAGGYGAAGSGYGAAGSGYGAAGSGYGAAGSGYGAAGSGYGAGVAPVAGVGMAGLGGMMNGSSGGCGLLDDSYSRY